MESLLGAIIGLLLGAGVGYEIRRQTAAKKAKTAEERADKIVLEAKDKQKEILLESREEALKIIDEAKKDEQSRRREMTQLQQRLEKRESLFDQKLLDLEKNQTELMEKAQKVEEVKKKIQGIQVEQLERLEKIAAMNKEEAKEVLLNKVEFEIKDDILSRMKKVEAIEAEKLDEKAKVMIAQAMQRCASSHATEITTTTLDLPSDEMKGRIIGREGRNIKAFEQLTGVEIIVDDTPNAITISGFSPIRRHIAKKALENLMLDGRIHPGRIEESIEKAKQEIALEIKKAGEEAVYAVGVAGFDPKLVQILGRLKYRTSYGQNVLQHSIEVAHLSAMLAAELGADVTVAKKAGLLHDIGKAVDHEVQGTHPEIGRDIAKKFNVPEDIIAPILTHHDDAPPTLVAVIVKVADAISGARPGARKDTYEHYLQRLEELEKVTTGFEGVQKAYAISAGREVRVFVVPEVLDDLGAKKLARDVVKKIEEELRYPGEIRVTVIRESRVVEYAR